MTMPETPVAANLNKTLDIKVNLFSEFTLNHELSADKVSEAINFIIGKAIHLGIRVDTGLRQNLPTQGRADAIDILQRNPNLFISGYIHPSYTCHLLPPCL